MFYKHKQLHKSIEILLSTQKQNVNNVDFIDFDCNRPYSNHKLNPFFNYSSLEFEPCNNSIIKIFILSFNFKLFILFNKIQPFNQSLILFKIRIYKFSNA